MLRWVTDQGLFPEPKFQEGNWIWRDRLWHLRLERDDVRGSTRLPGRDRFPVRSRTSWFGSDHTEMVNFKDIFRAIVQQSYMVLQVDNLFKLIENGQAFWNSSLKKQAVTWWSSVSSPLERRPWPIPIFFTILIICLLKLNVKCKWNKLIHFFAYLQFDNCCTKNNIQRSWRLSNPEW